MLLDTKEELIKKCNVCKEFSTRPYGKRRQTGTFPEYRTQGSRPFEVQNPLVQVSVKELEKCYLIVFMCASSRAVHLDVARTQTVDEFKKINAIISRQTRPCIINSDNATVFTATTDWVGTIRKSEKLQNHLAGKNIHWQFNLTRSPWWSLWETN